MGGGGELRRLDSAFLQFGAGIKTNRDAVVVGFDDKSLIESLREFESKLVADRSCRKLIHPLLYRPFDIRRIFYHEDLVASRSLPTMKHSLAGHNIGLIASSTWTTPERFSVNVSRLMVEMKTGTHDRGTTFFPLYRYEGLLGSKPDQRYNLTEEFVDDWARITRTRFVSIGRGDLESTSGPEDVLFWLYGLFHSPEYRRRYRATLAQGFPIVLLSSKKLLLEGLTRLGCELVALHLLESPRLERPASSFIGPADHPGVEKLSYARVWLDKAQTRGFRGVNESVWNFHIGGYPVCEKWLKDRKGRTLSKDEIAHYQKIVMALSETSG
jgi:predicted helicase